jgi:anti-anti-sigma regulatory factor
MRRSVLIDLGQTDGATRNGLTWLIELYIWVIQHGGHLAICGLHGQVRDQLERLKFNYFLPNFQNRELAMRVLADSTQIAA